MKTLNIKYDSTDLMPRKKDNRTEINQKKYLSSLLAAKTVTVEWKKKDQYNRILGVIYLGEVNINAEMIRSGFAWNYKYSKDKYYLELQEKTKAEKKGFWIDKNVIDL